MKNNTFILALIFLTRLFLGCKSEFFSSSENVTFCLPVLPCQTVQYWEIKTCNGFVTQSFTTTASSFTLELKKNQPFSIQAYPITQLQNMNLVSFYKPAGTVYPFDFDPTSKSQSLTWEGGYAANIFNIIASSCQVQGYSQSEAQSFLSRFNWTKLMKLLEQQTLQSFEDIQKSPSARFYNPWLLDSTKILENLSAHTFSSTCLDNVNLFTVSSQNIAESIQSSYVPQNYVINTAGYITLKKNTPQLLLEDNFIGIYVSGTTAKNLSLQWIYMPIIKEEL